MSLFRNGRLNVFRDCDRDTIDSANACALHTRLIRRGPMRFRGGARMPVGQAHVSDEDSGTPFEITSGNDDFGDWVLVLGSDDTPAEGGECYVIPKFQVISFADTGTTYIIHLGFGDTVEAAASDYTAASIQSPAAAAQSVIPLLEVLGCACHDVGTKAWVRVKVCGKNASTIELFPLVNEH